MKRLSCLELFKLEAEIKRLDETVDLCGDNDQDVLERCEARLNEIINIIEASIKLARIAEAGLRVVS